MKSFIFIIFSLLISSGGLAQSQLPGKMPETVSFSLHETGGMSRSYLSIKIENGVLEFEQMADNGKYLNQWSARISTEDLAKLYQTFVDHKFDTIKNHERQGIIYDAGSENITVTVNKLKSFRVTYGKNSPLSGTHLNRYQAVRQAIRDLTGRYQNQKNKVPTMDEAEKFIQGKWRATGSNGGYGWYLEWTFENGNFKQLGYPPITQTGKYRIVGVSDRTLKLELYDRKGTFGEEKEVIEVVLDQENIRLSILGTKGFSRID